MTKKVVLTENAPRPSPYYSQAIVADKFVFVAGHEGSDPKTGKCREGVKEQTRQALLNIKAILEAAGCTLEDVVKVNVHLVNIMDYPQMNEVYSTFFPNSPPARTILSTDLPSPFLLNIDCVALKK